jgi:hypothetical protein
MQWQHTTRSKEHKARKIRECVLAVRLLVSFNGRESGKDLIDPSRVDEGIFASRFILFLYRESSIFALPPYVNLLASLLYLDKKRAKWKLVSKPKKNQRSGVL